jgi:hypothetical protein
MKRAALIARLKGQLDSEQYQWLSATLDTLDSIDPQVRNAHPVHVLQLQFASFERVDGVFVFVRAGDVTWRHALVYTPDAPDDLGWRPLHTFSSTLAHAGMGDYYLERLRVSLGRRAAHKFAGLKQGNQLGREVFTQPLQNLYADFFEKRLELKLTNVQDSTVGRSEMVSRQFWVAFEILAVALTLPFPPASFVVGVVLWARDSGYALQAAERGDHAEAFGYILSAWLNALGAAGDLSGGLKGLAPVLRALSRSKPTKVFDAVEGVAKAGGPLPQDLSLTIDPQFALKHKPRGNLVYHAEGPKAGMYEGPLEEGFSTWYITDEVGHWYRVVADSDGLVRLFRRSAMHQHMPLKYLGDGHWEANYYHGGLGGNPTAGYLLRQAFIEHSDEQVQGLAGALQLAGPADPRVNRIRTRIANSTDAELERLLGDFPPFLRWDARLKLAQTIRRDGVFPKWALQFRGGSVHDTTAVMLGRANEGLPLYAQVRLEQFDFPEASRSSLQWQFALETEVFGVVPAWATAFRRAADNPVPMRPLLPAWRPRVAEVPGSPSFRDWASPAPVGLKPIEGAEGKFADVVGQEWIEFESSYYRILPDNGNPYSFGGVELPELALIYRPDDAQGVRALAYLDGGGGNPNTDIPHVVFRSANEWKSPFPVFLGTPPFEIIGSIYPALDDVSARHLFYWMMIEADRSARVTLTSSNLMGVSRTLGHWRLRTVPQRAPVSADPFQLLPMAEPTPGHGRRYILKRNDPRNHPMLTYRRRVGAEEMVELLAGNGYEIIHHGRVVAFGQEQLLVRYLPSNRLYLVIRSSNSFNTFSLPNVGWADFIDEYARVVPEPIQTQLRTAKQQGVLNILGAVYKSSNSLAFIKIR